MRRSWLVGPLFLLLCTTLVSGDPAPNVANTSQKGSVHVFPYVVADTNRTTFIRLANEGPGNIDMHCEFRDDADVRGGFVTTIKKRQAAWVDISNGVATYNLGSAQYPQSEGSVTSIGEGLLVCWAVDPGDTTQVRWNHVFGSATLVDYDKGTLFEYPSWAFQARTGADKAQVGPKAGEILLDGSNYDACPGSLHGVSGDDADVPPQPGDDPVIVTPCAFDVRQHRDAFTTRLRIRTWTAAGSGPTTTFDPPNNVAPCADFWNRESLPNATGSYQIDAPATGRCANQIGLVGVFYRPGDTARGGSGLAGSGSRSGWIYWDPSGPPE